MNFREGENGKLVDPLGGIRWIKDSLASKYGSSVHDWPEDVLEFFQKQASGIFIGWCTSNLKVLNTDPTDIPTISTGTSAITTKWYPCWWNKGERVVVGHIPMSCYVKVES